MFRSLLLLSTFCGLSLGMGWNDGFKHRRARRKAHQCEIQSGSYLISNAEGVLSMGSHHDLRVRKGDPSAWQLEKHEERRGESFYYLRYTTMGTSYVLSNELTLLVWDEVIGALDRVGKFALYDCAREMRGTDMTTQQFSAKIKHIEQQGFIKANDKGETEYAPKSYDDQDGMVWHFKGAELAPLSSVFGHQRTINSRNHHVAHDAHAHGIQRPFSYDDPDSYQFEY